MPLYVDMIVINAYTYYHVLFGSLVIANCKIHFIKAFYVITTFVSVFINMKWKFVGNDFVETLVRTRLINILVV